MIITCPCGKKLKVRDELAGKKAKCPTCGVIIPVPLSAPPAAAAKVEPPPRKAPANAKPQRPTAADEDLLEIEVEETPPKKTGARPQRPVIDEDDELLESEDDAAPLRKAGANAERATQTPPEVEATDEDESPGRPVKPQVWTHAGGAVVYLEATRFAIPLLETKKSPRAVAELKKGRDIQEVIDDYRMELPGGEEDSNTRVFSTDDIVEIRKDEKQLWLEVIVKANKQTFKPFVHLKDMAQRDEVFDAFRDRLGKSAKSQTVQHGRLGSIVLPLILLLVLPSPCVGLYFVDRIPEPEALVEPMRKKILRDALNFVFDTTGPIVFLGLAGVVALACALWLAFRFLNPPLLTTLRRRRQSEIDDED